MSHAHSASVSSNESDSSSLSTLSDSFSNSLQEKIESNTHTLTFIIRAQLDISLLRNHADRNLERPSTVDKDILPEAVLEAMLNHATGAREDDSQTPRRYVACAIATAGQDSGIEQLIELANTWVRYLFWPCR